MTCSKRKRLTFLKKRNPLREWLSKLYENDKLT